MDHRDINIITQVAFKAAVDVALKEGGDDILTKEDGLALKRLVQGLTADFTDVLISVITSRQKDVNGNGTPDNVRVLQTVQEAFPGAQVSAPATAPAPTCPRCGGDVYDNRNDNKARVAAGKKPLPAFKCKTPSCGWIQWDPSGKR